MSDGGKGSGRRVEDLEKIRNNWDLIDWGKKDTPVDLPEAATSECNEKCGCELLYNLKD
jgi:hypothetical protein